MQNNYSTSNRDVIRNSLLLKTGIANEGTMDKIYTKGMLISIISSFHAGKVNFAFIFFSFLLLNLPLIPQTKNSKNVI